MKKLQNCFTTPEQSKRLLEIGVPADSADCFYYDWDRNGHSPEVFDWYNREISDFKRRLSGLAKLPCWSVGRLMEVWDICANLIPGMQLNLNDKPESCTYIELIIGGFELATDDGLLDFSKLED